MRRTTDRPHLSIVLAAALMLAAFFAVSTAADDAVPYPGTDVYILNLPAARTLNKRVFEVRFLHRFQPSADDSDEHNLWGLDGPARVGLGLEAGLFKNVQAGIYRFSFRENWELSGKWHVGSLKFLHSQHTLRAGFNWLTDVTVSPKNDDYAFAQWAADFRIVDRVWLHVVPSYVLNTSDSGRDVFGVPAALSVRLTPNLHLLGEYHPRNRDLTGTHAGWAVGVDKKIGGHNFVLLVTNTIATNTSDYVVGDLSLDSHAFRLGFNLTRRFEMRKRR